MLEQQREADRGSLATALIAWIRTDSSGILQTLTQGLAHDLVALADFAQDQGGSPPYFNGLFGCKQFEKLPGRGVHTAGTHSVAAGTGHALRRPVIQHKKASNRASVYRLNRRQSPAEQRKLLNLSALTDRKKTRTFTATRKRFTCLPVGQKLPFLNVVIVLWSHEVAMAAQSCFLFLALLTPSQVDLDALLGRFTGKPRQPRMRLRPRISRS